MYAKMDWEDETCKERAAKSQQKEGHIEETAAEEVFSVFCQEQKQAILKAVEENSVVILHGDTSRDIGVQLPWILYEKGYAENNKIIGITEPEKLVAMGKAFKLEKDMNLPYIVASPLKESNEKTKIKFMVDSSLLCNGQKDPDLTQYSIIIIDEAQDRTFGTDLLVGWLPQVLPRRKEKNDPLKVILIFSTMRIKGFAENPFLFPKESPTLIEVFAGHRQVKIRYSAHIALNSLYAAYTEICETHSFSPPGAILVFLENKEEVDKLCAMFAMFQKGKDQTLLPKSYSSNSLGLNFKESHKKEERQKEKETTCKSSNNNVYCFPSVPYDEFEEDKMPLPLSSNDDEMCSAAGDCSEASVSDDKDFVCVKANSSEEILKKSEQVEEIMDLSNTVNNDNSKKTLCVQPLYSENSLEHIEKVFQPQPPNTRLCVITFDVAETFCNIPGIKYVIDSGKVTPRKPDAPEGLHVYQTEWISRVSSNIRSFFAACMEGGKCIRLYSSSVYDCGLQFYQIPEMRRLPVDEIVLWMKHLGISDVIKFPLPTVPYQYREVLRGSVRRLLRLGFLKVPKLAEESYNEAKAISSCPEVTPNGSGIISVSITPRYAKILLLSERLGCVSPVSAIVAAMVEPKAIFESAPPVKKSKSTVHQHLMKKILWKGIMNKDSKSGNSELGDAMVLLRVVALYEESKHKVKFCMKTDLDHKVMAHIRETRQQLCYEMKSSFPDVDISFPLELRIEPPNEEQIDLIQTILAAGFIDHVARLFSEEEVKSNKELKNAYQCLDLKDPVFIHPSSVLFNVNPEYVVYQEIVRTSKYFMKGVIPIKPELFPDVAPHMCEFLDLPDGQPRRHYDAEAGTVYYSRKVKFGPLQWEMKTVTQEMPEGTTKYMWFTFFLLIGEVYGFFRRYVLHLLLSPISMIESWDSLVVSTPFVEKINADKIGSKKSLQQKWAEDPKYLLKEFLELLPEEKHKKVESRWPPKQ